ncbi:MAG: ATP-grasp domain-containing protein [Clostridia bacterium]|nr:ATP-grasp domain-containing protein [Clostridia bacterium]
MKALVLAGGISQAALIQELKSRGIYTILADKNPKAVATAYADAFYPVSTLDEEGIYQLALKEKVNLVLTACADQVLLITAKVSERLGLPCYIDSHTATLVSDKHYMKEIFIKNGIPTAKHVVMDRYDQDKIKDFQFPLIVKPVDSYSSRGVRKVLNHEEMKKAFNEAVEISRTKTAIVEEFCVGEELTVDVYVENGIAHVLAISINDKIADKDRFVIYRTKNPAPLSEEVKQTIRDTAQKIADAFHLKDSPMLIQMICDGKRISVLEFCARTGGCIKYRLIKKASGFDVIKAVADLTLGKKPHVDELVAESKYVSNTFLYCKPGVFDHAEGFEELKKEGIISEYYIFSSRGTEYKTITCSGDRMGGFTVQADDLQELKDKHQTAIDRVKAIGRDGCDLIRHDLVKELTY